MRCAHKDYIQASLHSVTLLCIQSAQSSYILTPHYIQPLIQPMPYAIVKRIISLFAANIYTTAVAINKQLLHNNEVPAGGRG